MLKAFDHPRYDSLLSATNVLYAQRKFNQLREINARGEKWEHCGPIILSASYTTTCHGRIVMEHLCITHEYQSQLIQMCMFFCRYELVRIVYGRYEGLYKTMMKTENCPRCGRERQKNNTVGFSD